MIDNDPTCDTWITQPFRFVIGLGRASKGIAFGRGMFAPLDPSVNELYAFHGTFVRYALSIAENEARLNRHQESIGPWISFKKSAACDSWVTHATVFLRTSILTWLAPAPAPFMAGAPTWENPSPRHLGGQLVGQGAVPGCRYYCSMSPCKMKGRWICQRWARWLLRGLALVRCVFLLLSGFRWLFCVNVELNLSKVFGPVVCVFYCFLVGFSLEVPTLSSGGRLRSSGLPCDDGENECHSQWPRRRWQGEKNGIWLHLRQALLVQIESWANVFLERHGPHVLLSEMMQPFAACISFACVTDWRLFDCSLSSLEWFWQAW